MQPDVEPALGERVPQGRRLESIGVVVEAGPGAGLAAGHRIDEEQDRPAGHSIPRWYAWNDPSPQSSTIRCGSGSSVAAGANPGST